MIESETLATKGCPFRAVSCVGPGFGIAVKSFHVSVRGQPLIQFRSSDLIRNLLEIALTIEYSLAGNQRVAKFSLARSRFGAKNRQESQKIIDPVLNIVV